MKYKSEIQNHYFIIDLKRQQALMEPDNPISDSKRIRRNRFSPEEDRKLRQLVGNKKAPNWNEIAYNMENRSARQCRERYINYLRVDLTTKRWTKEEDLILLDMFEKYGPKWSIISQQFSNRSSVNIKNHYSSLLHHKTLKRKPLRSSHRKTAKLQQQHQQLSSPSMPLASVSCSPCPISNPQSMKLSSTSIFQPNPLPIINQASNQDTPDILNSSNSNIILNNDKYFEDLFANIDFDEDSPSVTNLFHPTDNAFV